MANKFDWFFEQLVTEAELDEAFDNIETSIQNMIADQSYDGVYLGLGVTEATVPDLTVDIAGGRGYDANGQRIYVPTTQNLDVSVDSNAASTAVVTPGNEKWVSVFVRFVRSQSDQRFDGNGSPVFFRNDESFEFNVVQGAEALIGSASRPALIAGEILIADINLVNAQTQIFDADIESSDTATDPNSRFQYAFNLTSSSPATVRVGPLPDAMQAILTELNDHIAQVANAHDADAVVFDATNLPIPAAWSDVDAATEVQAAIDGIVNDLTQSSGVDGASLVGFDPAAATGITSTNVAGALDELATEKANLDGGNTWTGLQLYDNDPGGRRVEPSTNADQYILRETILETGIPGLAVTAINNWTLPSNCRWSLHVRGVFDCDEGGFYETIIVHGNRVSGGSPSVIDSNDIDTHDATTASINGFTVTSDGSDGINLNADINDGTNSECLYEYVLIVRGD